MLFPVRRSLPCAMKRLTITIAVLVAAAVAAPAANASSRQLLIMQDDAQVRSAPGHDARPSSPAWAPTS